VDDEQLSREVISKVLNRYLGCDVYMVSNGNDALGFFYSDDFDLFMIDLKLPGISGIELIKNIKLNKPGSALIVVTGNADDKSIDEIKRLGVSQIVYKPFKIAALLETVAETLFENKRLSNFA
jgi:CheY-like chemotaxis protein